LAKNGAGISEKRKCGGYCVQFHPNRKEVYTRNWLVWSRDRSTARAVEGGSPVAAGRHYDVLIAWMESSATRYRSIPRRQIRRADGD
jgi:hypothetical protein